MKHLIIDLLTDLPKPKPDYFFYIIYGQGNNVAIGFIVGHLEENIQYIKIKETDTEIMKEEKITNIKKLITEYARVEGVEEVGEIRDQGEN